MPATRVTVTLPDDLLAEMDRQVENRSLFVAEAIKAELVRRREQRFVEALRNPHPESAEMADLGFREWTSLSDDGDAALIDPAALRPVRWDPASGWDERN